MAAVEEVGNLAPDVIGTVGIAQDFFPDPARLSAPVHRKGFTWLAAGAPKAMLSLVPRTAPDWEAKPSEAYRQHPPHDGRDRVAQEAPIAWTISTYLFAGTRV